MRPAEGNKLTRHDLSVIVSLAILCPVVRTAGVSEATPSLRCMLAGMAQLFTQLLYRNMCELATGFSSLLHKLRSRRDKLFYIIHGTANIHMLHCIH